MVWIHLNALTSDPRAPMEEVFVSYWCNKPLPKLPLEVVGFIKEIGDDVLLTLSLPHDRRIQFKESIAEFPSDTLIAQLMLVV